MRLLCIAAIALLTGCASGPVAGSARYDATKEAWYAPTVAQLAALNREAESFYQNGRRDDAAAAIEKAKPLMARVLSVSRPSVGAMEAASDLDHLYGRMLLGNRHYGWARMLFQKNLARWKHWEPQTPETARRLKQAETAIVECDRRMAE